MNKLHLIKNTEVIATLHVEEQPQINYFIDQLLKEIDKLDSLDFKEEISRLIANRLGRKKYKPFASPQGDILYIFLGSDEEAMNFLGLPF